MTYDEFEQWAAAKMENDFDGLDRIDLMWEAYQKGQEDEKLKRTKKK